MGTEDSCPLDSSLHYSIHATLHDPLLAALPFTPPGAPLSTVSVLSPLDMQLRQQVVK